MEKRKKPKFVRQASSKMLKLGKKVKKKRKWRRPTGGDSKVRLKERGYRRMPSIGWGSDKKGRGKIEGLKVVNVKSSNDLENLEKNAGIIICKVGKKKKEEIIKKAKEKGLKVLNRYKKSGGKDATA